MTDNSRVRVSIVGVIVVALFAALLARLWFLQISSGQTFEVQVDRRSLRTVQTESPRGQILSSDLTPIVSNRVVWALTVERTLSDAQRSVVFGRLAEALGGNYTLGLLERRFHDQRQSPLQPALLVLDTPEPARVTILEHHEDYPGVQVRQVTVRSYPQGSLAAQTLGYVGQINGDELKNRKGYVNGDTIGRSGIERVYEQYLRGRPRIDQYEVAPTGYPVGDPVKTRAGAVGDNVQLTINLKVQQVAEQTLADAELQARTNRLYKNKQGGLSPFTAPGGSIVVLNADTGGIVAMASNPTYDLGHFVGSITNSEWQLLNAKASHQPLTNRVTQGLYAPGSTFKLVTSTAANRDGVFGANQYFDDKGSITIGADKRSFHNANNEVLGPLSLQKALTESSDVYFYNIGYQFWQRWNANKNDATGLGIQQVAQEFGFGSKTGVELDEQRGRVPSPAWKAAFAKILYPNDKQKQLENSQWFPGDNVNFSVGQGDLVVTPLQLADAYAAFENGGTLYEPHVAQAVRAPDGTIVKSIAPKVVRRIAFDPYVHSVQLAGFQGAVSDPKGTAYSAFQGWNFAAVPLAGKTGTAQVTNQGDTSLFVGMFTVGARHYVVATVIEDAGFGSEVAAPASRRVIEQVAGLSLTPLTIAKTTGSNTGTSTGTD
jgi:penicillin-binding protein 2